MLIKKSKSSIDDGITFDIMSDYLVETSREIKPDGSISRNFCIIYYKGIKLCSISRDMHNRSLVVGFISGEDRVDICDHNKTVEMMKKRMKHIDEYI